MLLDLDKSMGPVGVTKYFLTCKEICSYNYLRGAYIPQSICIYYIMMYGISINISFTQLTVLLNKHSVFLYISQLALVHVEVHHVRMAVYAAQ